MKKIGSILTLENKDVNLKIGTIDKKNPEVIYFEGSFYIKPIINKETYKSDIDRIKNTLNDLLKEWLKENKNFKKNFMFLLDVADEWIKYNKKSYLSFQLYLKPSDDLLKEEKNFNNLSQYLKENNICDTSFIKDIFVDNGYCTYKTKS